MAVELVCGTDNLEKKPLRPYSDVVCSFLDDYAALIRKDDEAKKYADVQTFGFWIRRANIVKRKEDFFAGRKNLAIIGKGIVYHIAPSNVPVNCMFTYVFGLLAGNSNIVRIPTKKYPQVECMCRLLNAMFEDARYKQIKNMTMIVRYERDEEITDMYSSMCNLRVIWGGDAAISDIRKSKLPPRSTEITFADRYSFGVIDAQKLAEADEKCFEKLVSGFYNDTYLMDQNACSTPHLICWQQGNLPLEIYSGLKKKFWTSVADNAALYVLEDIKVSEKYSMLCEAVMLSDKINNIERFDNRLYICRVNELSDNIYNQCRGKFGLFYEYDMKEWAELSVLNNEKVQTCAYFGDNKKELIDYIIDNAYVGIDRVVSFGNTLDIDVIWDGYDIIGCMSRIIG